MSIAPPPRPYPSRTPPDLPATAALTVLWILAALLSGSAILYAFAGLLFLDAPTASATSLLARVVPVISLPIALAIGTSMLVARLRRQGHRTPARLVPLLPTLLLASALVWLVHTFRT